MKTISALALTTALVTAAAPALAQSRGDMTLGLGVGWVNPTDSYSATLVGPVRADDNVRPTLTFEYFVADNIGLEILAAWPFEHTASIQGVGNAIKTKHLPPTLSLNYHFTNSSSWTPFLGLGINYTHFFDEKATGVVPAGTPVSLSDSWGVAVNAGVDYAISDNSAVRANVRWIDINTDATVGGVNIGEVEIDPWILNLAYVYKF